MASAGFSLLPVTMCLFIFHNAIGPVHQQGTMSVKYMPKDFKLFCLLLYDDGFVR